MERRKRAVERQNVAQQLTRKTQKESLKLQERFAYSADACRIRLVELCSATNNADRTFVCAEGLCD